MTVRPLRTQAEHGRNDDVKAMERRKETKTRHPVRGVIIISMVMIVVLALAAVADGVTLVAVACRRAESAWHMSHE